MKTILILLKDGRNILVSDEEPYPYAYHINKNEILEINGVGEKSKELFHSKGFNYSNECKKVIGGYKDLPTLIYSDEVEQILRDKYRWVDVDYSKLCYYDRRNPDFLIKKEYGYNKEEIEATGNFAKEDCACDNCFYGRSQLTEQLILLKSITNKMFSLEDIEIAYQKGVDACIKYNYIGHGIDYDMVYAEQAILIQSLKKPIQLKVETQTKNNLILITKILTNG